MPNLENLPHYKNWPSVPDTLKSKTKWRQEGYKLKEDAVPQGKIYGKQSHQWIYLYAIEACVPIKAVTAKQSAALKRAHEALQQQRTCDVCGQEEVHVKWIMMIDDKKHCRSCHAVYLMEQRELEVVEQQKEVAAAFEEYLHAGAVILDTETTGLSSNDEVIEIAIIDANEAVLFHGLYKPTVAVSAGALAVHGYTDEFLADKPSISTDYDRLKALLTGRTVLIYNASFDDELLHHTLLKHGLAPIEYNSICVMHMMMEYYDSKRFISLANTSGYETSHDALGDCYQVLAMMQDVIQKYKGEEQE